MDPAAAILMTPFNLALWGGLNPATEPILRAVALRPVDVLTTIVLILGVPLTLGLLVSRLYPGLVERVRKPFKILSVLIFFAVVVLALKRTTPFAATPSSRTRTTSAGWRRSSPTTGPDGPSWPSSSSGSAPSWGSPRGTRSPICWTPNG